MVNTRIPNTKHNSRPLKIVFKANVHDFSDVVMFC